MLRDAHPARNFGNVHNNKSVLRTAVFVIRATICERAPLVALTTKATLTSGFIVVRIALVIPAGFECRGNFN